MKRWTLSFVCMLLPALAGAQNVEVGLKGGIAFAQLPDYMDTLEDYGANDVAGRLGVVFGAHVAFPITGSVAVQPEALYTQRGVKADDLPFAGDEFQLRLDYLDVPVLLRIAPSVSEGLQFLVGPSFNFNTRARLVVNDSDVDDGEDIKDEVEDIDIGVVVGVGYYGAGLLFEGRYQEGLTNVAEFPDFSRGDESYRNRTFTVMFGIRFGG